MVNFELLRGYFLDTQIRYSRNFLSLRQEIASSNTAILLNLHFLSLNIQQIHWKYLMENSNILWFHKRRSIRSGSVWKLDVEHEVTTFRRHSNAVRFREVNASSSWFLPSFQNKTYCQKYKTRARFYHFWLHGYYYVEDPWFRLLV